MRELFPTLRDDEIYLDTATTSLPPGPVLDLARSSIAQGTSPGRSVHTRSQSATDRYEGARRQVAQQLGVAADEIVFVPSATAGLNLVAKGWAQPKLGPGDEILVSVAEHNANFLPWHQLAAQCGATIIPIALDEHGDIDAQDLAQKLRPATRVVALTHVSNVTGATSDLSSLIATIKSSKSPRALICIDGAQALAHLPVDLSRLDCDFYVLSGHKCYGLPGAAAVWAPKERWAQTTPLWVGGGSVELASFDEVRYAQGPARFESGTPNVAAAQCMAAGMEFARKHLGQESALLATLVQHLQAISCLRILGSPKTRTALVSWVHKDMHAHDVGTILAQAGISVRVGHMCAQRLLQHFGAPSCIRASLGVHTEASDIDQLIQALQSAKDLLVSPKSYG